MLGSNKLLITLLLSSGLTLTACKKEGGGSSGNGRGARPAAKTTNKPTPKPTINEDDSEVTPPDLSGETEPQEDSNITPSSIDNSAETNPSTENTPEETPSKPAVLYDPEETGVSIEETEVKLPENTGDGIKVEQDDDRPDLSAAQVAAQVAEVSSKTSNQPQTQTCLLNEKQLKELNWERKEIEVAEVPNQKDSQKIKISYYTQTQKELKNPVFLIQDFFRPVTIEDLKYFNEVSKRYDLNLVTMDPRGAGCSAAMPAQDELSRWQNYGSRGLAQDIEAIRKALLNDRKWKILAHGTGGYVALRLVELYPNGIKSLHVADFTPMKSFTEYMTLRMEAQKEAWNSFTNYTEKEKKFTITEDEVKKAHQTLDKSECSDQQKICGAALFDIFAYVIKTSSPKAWDQATELLKDLVHGELDKLASLKNRALSLERRYIYAVAVRMIDMDSDLEQKACSEALKNEELKKSSINTCRVEVALGRKEIDQLKGTLKHETLNHEKIKKNLKQHKIDYHYAVADRSLFNPIKAAREHVEGYKDVLKNQDFITIPKTSEAAFRSEILTTLK